RDLIVTGVQTCALPILLARGFDLDHIRGSGVAPQVLAANRALGDNGDYVSAREVCESSGIDVELLQRLHHATGLPRIEDPDAVRSEERRVGKERRSCWA